METMSLRSNFELMADYNQWMNKSIYQTASDLDIAELTENRGAFFGSIIGTLNHILVGDTIWLKRFANHPSNLIALEYVRELESPKALDAILHTELEILSTARERMDDTILKFSHELTDDILSSSLEYRNTRGELFIKNFGHLIQHFFNHQTHHRGQVSTLFSQLNLDISMTDLVARIPNVKKV